MVFQLENSINSTLPANSKPRHLSKETVQQAAMAKHQRRRNVSRDNSRKQKGRCCQRCLYDLRPQDTEMEHEGGFLPPISPGSLYLSGRYLTKEDTFSHVINSLANANRVLVGPQLSPTCSSTNSVYLQGEPSQQEHSNWLDVSTESSGDRVNSHHNSVTIVSEVPPAANHLYVPLEEILNYGEKRSRKVNIRCSKYSEIGNPQARRRKHSRRDVSTDRKWNRKLSYADGNAGHGRICKERLNFMDSQSSSIYNSFEKWKIDQSITPRGKDEKTTLRTVLPQILVHRGSVEKGNIGESHDQKVSNLMVKTIRAKKMDKIECKIPTIPLSLPSIISKVSMA